MSRVGATTAATTGTVPSVTTTLLLPGTATVEDSSLLSPRLRLTQRPPAAPPLGVIPDKSKTEVDVDDDDDEELLPTFSEETKEDSGEDSDTGDQANLRQQQQQQQEADTTVVAATSTETVTLPPTSVLPRELRIDSVSGSQISITLSYESRSGVGLLRRLSLYHTHLSGLYQALFNHLGRPTWALVVDKLFGAHSSDEFLGFGRLGVPGHDSMGLFPLFSDQYGREYFDGAVPRTASMTPDRQGLITLGMRIPRQYTKRYNARSGRAPRLPLDKEPLFPKPGEKLILEACYVPFLPFYWDTHERAVQSIVQDRSDQQLLQTRFVRMSYHASKERWHSTKFHAAVLTTDSARDASCIIEVQIRSQTLGAGSERVLLHNIQVAREEWCINIRELFESVFRADRDGRLTLAVIEYMQQEWLPAVSKHKYRSGRKL